MSTLALVGWFVFGVVLTGAGLDYMLRPLGNRPKALHPPEGMGPAEIRVRGAIAAVCGMAWLGMGVVLILRFSA